MTDVRQANPEGIGADKGYDAGSSRLARLEGHADDQNKSVRAGRAR